MATRSVEKLLDIWYKPSSATTNYNGYGYPVTLKMLRRGLDYYKKKLTRTEKVEDVKQN